MDKKQTLGVIIVSVEGFKDAKGGSSGVSRGEIKAVTGDDGAGEFIGVETKAMRDRVLRVILMMMVMISL